MRTVFEIKEETAEKIPETEKNKFYEAAKSGDIATVVAFIKSYKDVNENTECNSALHYAAQYGHLNIVKLLLDNGAKINAQNELELTPLHFAAKHNQIEIIDHLIKSGAKANIQTSALLTPAHLITQNNNLEAIRSFAKWKMDPTIVDGSGHNAWVYLYAYGYINTIQTLIAEGCNIECSYHVTKTNLYWIFGGEKIAEEFGLTKDDHAVTLVGNDYIVNEKLRPFHIEKNEDVVKLLLFYLTYFLIKKNINSKLAALICNHMKNIMDFKLTENSHLEIMKVLDANETFYIARKNILHGNIVSFEVDPKDNQKIIFRMLDKAGFIIKDKNLDIKRHYSRKLIFDKNKQTLKEVIDILRKCEVMRHIDAKKETLTKLPKITHSKFEIETENKTSLTKAGLCFFVNAKRAIHDLMCRYFGIKDGNPLFKEFILSFQKNSTADFGRKNKNFASRQLAERCLSVVKIKEEARKLKFSSASKQSETELTKEEDKPVQINFSSN